jgi:hypothetical protein
MLLKHENNKKYRQKTKLHDIKETLQIKIEVKNKRNSQF